MIVEVLVWIENDVFKNISVIHFIKLLPVIWNQSVGWLNKAYNAVNDVAFLKKICLIEVISTIALNLLLNSIVCFCRPLLCAV